MPTVLTVLGAAALAAAQPAPSALRLTSADVADGAPIAPDFIYPRCGGRNVSPELAWIGAPAGTRSFAITMIDLDVRPDQWSHWVVTGIPPEATRIARGASTLPTGAHAVISNFGDAAYDGPCPPAGTGKHRYRLTVWALPESDISVVPDAKAKALAERLEGAALAHAEITAFVDAPAR